MSAGFPRIAVRAELPNRTAGCHTPAGLNEQGEEISLLESVFTAGTIVRLRRPLSGLSRGTFFGSQKLSRMNPSAVMFRAMVTAYEPH